MEKGENMFDDFKDELLKSIPVRYVRLVPMKEKIESINALHSYGCFTAMDLFKFSKEEKKDTPAMFIIPYDRKNWSARFASFLEMGDKADLLVDDKTKGRYGCIHIVCEFTNTLSKDITVPIIKGVLDDTNARYYSFLSETWVVKQKKPYDRDLDGLPSEHPDKKEKLLICTSDPTENIMTMKDIKDDKLSGGKLQRTKADVSVGGRFSNLFLYQRDDKTVH
jgi:hypothetical protein|tara:strand:- start:205 stop:870 length:666 start_codon:yes stop_codon:yes gene_type:complete